MKTQNKQEKSKQAKKKSFFGQGSFFSGGTKSGGNFFKSKPLKSQNAKKGEGSGAGNSNPKLSKEDAKDYTYGEVTDGALYVDNAGNEIDSSDETGAGIELDDVKQGSLADCYFLAAVGAFAQSDPSFLKTLIKDNGDGTYDVTLHVYEHFWSMDRTPHVETVSLDFPMKSDGTTPAYAKFGDNKEVWVMLLEKAFAQYEGSYEDIEWGHADKAMSMLSGNDSETKKPSSLTEDEIATFVNQGLNNNLAMTAATKNFGLSKSLTKTSDNLNLVGKHVYVIESVDVAGKQITLYNPWGSSITLSISDFKEHFKNIQTNKR